MADPVLSVRNLTTSFSTRGQATRAVEDVSFDVPKAKTVALIGESGGGKTVTALSIFGLIGNDEAAITGSVVFEGQDLLRLSDREFRKLRGGKIAMAFQEPLSAMDATRTLGSQLTAVARQNADTSPAAARQRAKDLFRALALPFSDEDLQAYPHQVSAGTRQRATLAMALASEPTLLIADSPTTFVDPKTRAHVMDTLVERQSERGASTLLITNDLSAAAEVSQEIVVMYRGRVMERGPTEGVLTSPCHPYTRELVATAFVQSAPDTPHKGRYLEIIEEPASEFATGDAGCRFRHECSVRRRRPEGYERCDEKEPELVSVDDYREVRCYFSDCSS